MRLLALAWLIGCAEPSVAPTSCEVATAHPIDAVVSRKLGAECIPIVEEEDDRLCRRLYADLIGRYPTRDEQAECQALDLDGRIDRLQAHPRAKLQAQRFWRGQLRSFDIFRDPRDLVSLFELVGALQERRLTYDAFALEVSIHPGFLYPFDLQEQNAEWIFRAFLDRRPSDYERRELARLYIPYVDQTAYGDGIEYSHLFVDLSACQTGRVPDRALRRCVDRARAPRRRADPDP